MQTTNPQEIGSHREGERPQVPYALELASYAEIFEELSKLSHRTRWGLQYVSNKN